MRGAIKANNLPALNVLWKGIYYHDRSGPWFEKDLEVAAEYAGPTMFLHILYGYMNYPDLNGTNPIDYAKIQALANKNSCFEMTKLIHELKEFVNDNNQIPVMSKLKSMGTPAEITQEQITKFYEWAKNFMVIR